MRVEILKKEVGNVCFNCDNRPCEQGKYSPYIVYTKADNKRGKYHPMCCKECAEEYVKTEKWKKYYKA
jgi:hypothetical protein